jgi:hypothetical protein
VILPVPFVLILPAVGDTAPPLFPVRVNDEEADVDMVILFPALVMLIPEPAVIVPAAGAPVLEPMMICPLVSDDHVGMPALLIRTPFPDPSRVVVTVLPDPVVVIKPDPTSFKTFAVGIAVPEFVTNASGTVPGIEPPPDEVL